ncbi:flavodoxin domain-containing protein [Dehalococcoidia bacterium]|nr:flavodoxin domain-containing protein [Dehalococcoidia bacterium]
MKTLFVCGSRYGSTRVIGEWIAERLGFDSLITDAGDAPDPGEFDLVMLGSGIYNDGFIPGVMDYIDRHIEVLEDKKKVIFGVCLDTTGVFVKGKIHGGWEYIMPAIRKFQNPPLHAGLLHGEINPAKLTTEDYEKLMHFYNKMLKRDYSAIPYKTKMNKEEVWAFAERILNKLDGKVF